MIIVVFVNSVLAQENETKSIFQSQGNATTSQNFSQYLEYLNHNSGGFNVIFSGLVAVATIVYALLTWKLVSETRKMREAQTEPNIIITIQPSEEWINFIDIIIQNIGLGPAYIIKFETSPDFEYEKGKSLSELGIMKQGLKILAPNQKYKFFLTNMLETWAEKTITPETGEEKITQHETFAEKIKTQFDIKVTYQNSIGKKYEYTYPIDFTHLAGLIQTGTHPLYKISENIEDIKKDIHSLSTGKKMNVVVHTKKEVEDEKKKWLEQAKKQVERAKMER